MAETAVLPDRWLNRFHAAIPIATQGPLHVYRALHDGAPRLVIVAGPDEPLDRVRARLDGIAAAHERLSHPRIPRLCERGAVGEVEFVSFECDAVATMHAVLMDAENHGRPIDQGIFVALVRALSEPVGAAHAVAGADGAPICLAIATWAKAVVSRDGKVWLWGFGDRFLSGRMSLRDTVPSYVAPEVMRGAAPSPAADINSAFQLLLSVYDTVQLSERTKHALRGEPLPGDEMVATGAIDFMMRMGANDAKQRPQAVAEVIALAEGLAAAVGDPPNHAGLQRVIMEHCARTVDDDRTVERPIEPHAPHSPRFWDRGRYRAERTLGKGAMGTVHLAWDREVEQQVAIKTLRSDASSVQRQRFVREVRLMRALRHPNLVSGYDLVQEGRELAAVMEYVAGEPLSEAMRRLGDDPPRAAGVVAAIADALACLHEAGVVHRDVKPANVIVHARRGPVLVDLGIATEQGSHQLTQTGAVIGTLLYMSPEQFFGEPAEPRSDVYSACLVLLEILQREHPFAASSVADLVVTRKTSIDDMLDGRVPEALHPILRRGLGATPAERCRADELRDALRAFAEGAQERAP